MLGKRSKLKYVAVEKDEHPAENNVQKDSEISLSSWKSSSSSCVWSSFFTTVLIGTYYIPSICLTFYQRWLLQTYHFPLFIVVVHMAVKLLLACIVRLILVRKFGKKRLMAGWKEYILVVAPVGISSGLDIGLSNWGLELTKISLYTMTKSTTIVFILAFSILFKLEKKSWSLCVIVVMITIGLILFTYKATQFDLFGFVLLLFASMSSGVRWTCVQLLMQKSKMGINSPIDMIYHMQPWMIVSVLPFAVFIEGTTVLQSQLFNFTDYSAFFSVSCKILLGAFIAFFMEVTEVMVITYTSSLTLAIAGIFKEVFVLVLAVEWNGDQMSPINIAGLLICLCGITCHVIHKLKNAPPKLNARLYDLENEHFELGENLMDDNNLDVDSESDISDSQVLFEILNRHER